MKNNIVISLIVGIVFAIMAVCSSLILTKSGQNKKDK